MDDAEKIRQKRLAKIGGLATSSESSAGPSADSTDSKLSSSSAMAPAPAPVTSAAVPIKLADARVTSVAASAVSSEPNAKIAVKAPSALFTKQQWDNDVLEQVFLLTCNPAKSSELYYFTSLAADFLSNSMVEDDTQPVLMPATAVEEIVVSRLMAHMQIPTRFGGSAVSLFEYLYDGYERLASIKRNPAKGKHLAPADREAIFDSVRALLVSYAGIVLQSPDGFEQAESYKQLGAAILTSFLLPESGNSKQISNEFLEDLVKRFADEGLGDIFNPVLMSLSAKMRTQTVLTDYNGPINALISLSAKKPLAQLITSLPQWLPEGNTNARQFEKISFIGPFFSVSAFGDDQPAVASYYFSDPHTRRADDIRSSMNTLRSSLRTLQNGLHQIILNLLKASPESRERVLAFFGTALRKNEKRAQMQVDRATVSTEGFMTNLFAVALKLCDPFMDVNSPKIATIDPEYFRKSNRIDLSKHTRLRASEEEAKAYTSSEPSNTIPINFITECFFITFDLFHISILRTFKFMEALIRDIKEIERVLRRMDESRDLWINSPTGRIQEEQYKRMKTMSSAMISSKVSYEAALLDPELLSHAFRFCNLASVFLIRTVDPENLGLPLSSTVSPHYAIYPEFFVEDICEFVLEVLKTNPVEIMSVWTLDTFIKFSIYFLSSPNYSKNPYMRSKFCEVLYFINPDTQKKYFGGVFLPLVLDTNALARRFLARSLTSYYIDVENTGDSHQFYVKFNIRYHIAIVLKYIWNHEEHRQRIKELSQDTDFFVKFANLLMNDARYLLDESLSKLTEIHGIQNEMANQAVWNALPQDQRQQREANLQQSERMAQSLVLLATETVHMLSYLTTEIVDPFLRPEIVDRLAAMLNFNLAQLVGPKCTELKVANPEKFGFQPKTLLGDIIDIYLHLHKPAFIGAISRDGRSYKKEYFDSACRILRKNMIRPEDAIESLEKLVSQVETFMRQEKEEEQELGEIPDEFLDPVLFHLMEDPVILPTSNVTVDRSTIHTHLLSDPKDPFNRMPLTIDMVIPNVELRQKIVEFKKGKRQG